MQKVTQLMSKRMGISRDGEGGEKHGSLNENSRMLLECEYGNELAVERM